MGKQRDEGDGSWYADQRNEQVIYALGDDHPALEISRTTTVDIETIGAGNSKSMTKPPAIRIASMPLQT